MAMVGAPHFVSRFKLIDSWFTVHIPADEVLRLLNKNFPDFFMLARRLLGKPAKRKQPTPEELAWLKSEGIRRLSELHKIPCSGGVGDRMRFAGLHRL